MTNHPAPAPNSRDKQSPIARLLEIMALLRDPDKGCPWDVEQTFATIAPHTIEEAYEVAEAIENNDMAALVDELGDLLLQVVFHAQIADEAKTFNFDDVARAICDKLVRRHPHVFGEEDIRTAEAQTHAWEAQKAEERRQKAQSGDPQAHHSAIDGVSVALPALMRAYKLQKRAARVGFDWPDAQGAIEKVTEELAEVVHEINTDYDTARLNDEVGDLLFSCVNVARKLGLDPETSLRHANAKFERRFRRLEQGIESDGKKIDDMSLQQLDALWDLAKDDAP